MKNSKPLINENKNETVTFAWYMFAITMILWFFTNFIVGAVGLALTSCVGFIGIADVRRRGGLNEDKLFISGLMVSALPIIIIFCKIAFTISSIMQEAF